MSIIQGINGVNRELKQIYKGIGGVNRELKERWQGVGGVNRKVFSNTPSNALYWFGDECISRTNGWSSVGYTYNGGQVGAGTKGVDYLYIDNTSVNIKAIGTVDAINLTDYNILKVEALNSGTNDTQPYITVLSSGKSINGTNYLGDSLSLPATRGIVSKDISTITGLHNIVLCTSSSGTIKGYVYRVWLE